MKIIDDLLSEWPSSFSLQPETISERFDVIAIQKLKKEAAFEIERLTNLIKEHNDECIKLCDKDRCGYAPYKRDCPTCPKDWMIDI